MKKPATILIIDNEPDICESTQILLQQRGHQVFTAQTVNQAWEIFNNNRINLAIIDVKLADHSDPDDYSGLDMAAKLDPIVSRIILTGFQTPNLTRKALFAGYKDKIVPADDIVDKQDGPRQLLQVVKEVLTKASAQINSKLDLKYDKGYRLTSFVGQLKKTSHLKDLEPEELEELFRRLFRKESAIKLYYIPPGSGGSNVALVRPSYDKMDGAPVIVKFGPIEQIEKEIKNYKKYVEPFVLQRSTVVVGQPVRTHRLMGCQLRFVGNSVEHPQSFNDFYQDDDVDDVQIQQAIRNIFEDTCKIWYQGRQEWDRKYGTFTETMLGQLSLDVSSPASELSRIYQTLVTRKPFGRVSFTQEEKNRLTIEVDGKVLKQNPINPLYFLKTYADLLPGPTYAAITHGDLNGHNLFVDESSFVWLIDFYRTGWGPLLRDAAELESAIKFELLDSNHLPVLLAFEEAILAPDNFLDPVNLPPQAAKPEFKRALAAIQAIRSSASDIAGTGQMEQYYALLLFYALKMMTWKGLSSGDTKRQKERQRHALFSAALLADKFVPSKPTQGIPE